MFDRQASFSDPKMLAVFLAQLEREGIEYAVRSGCGCWHVLITGLRR